MFSIWDSFLNFLGCSLILWVKEFSRGGPGVWGGLWDLIREPKERRGPIFGILGSYSLFGMGGLAMWCGPQVWITFLNSGVPYWLGFITRFGRLGLGFQERFSIGVTSINSPEGFSGPFCLFQIGPPGVFQGFIGLVLTPGLIPWVSLNFLVGGLLGGPRRFFFGALFKTFLISRFGANHGEGFPLMEGHVSKGFSTSMGAHLSRGFFPATKGPRVGLLALPLGGAFRNSFGFGRGSSRGNLCEPLPFKGPPQMGGTYLGSSFVHKGLKGARVNLYLCPRGFKAPFRGGIFFHHPAVCVGSHLGLFLGGTQIVCHNSLGG